MHGIDLTDILSPDGENHIIADFSVSKDSIGTCAYDDPEQFEYEATLEDLYIDGEWMSRDSAIEMFGLLEIQEIEEWASEQAAQNGDYCD